MRNVYAPNWRLVQTHAEFLAAAVHTITSAYQHAAWYMILLRNAVPGVFHCQQFIGRVSILSLSSKWDT